MGFLEIVSGKSIFILGLNGLEKPLVLFIPKEIAQFFFKGH